MSVFKRQCVAAVLLFLSANYSASQAGVMSGEDLLGICKPSPIDPVSRLKISQCTGYIIGVSDTFDCMHKTLGFNWNAKRFNDQQELVATVVNWFRLHPNVLHYQASGLVASALSTGYPCLNSTSQR